MKQIKKPKTFENAQKVIHRTIGWMSMFVLMTFAVYLVQLNTFEFQVSILPTAPIPAFDGTVYPVQKVPNWVALSSSEWNYNYSQIPSNKLIDIPVYNPTDLKKSTNTLTWGNAAHDAIRNAKITYSVPYMGNYELDGVEYAGSHLAVDIKIPEGTPVYAIANGQVIKKQIQSSGFGNHMVIKHPNVSSFENPSIKKTYYSSYNHMKTLIANEGSVVKKGDLIGYSGNSGLSTTPHLHFQIDNENAPWYPYWPFTSQEASNAGLTFTQAINSGFNQSKAIANTVNPMIYVQKYLNGQVNTTNTQPAINTQPVTNSQPTITPTSTPAANIEEVEDNTNVNTVPTEGYVTFEFDGPLTFKEREQFNLKIKAVNRSGIIIDDYVPSEAIKIEILRGEASIDPNRLVAKDFKNGIATIAVTPLGKNEIQFKLKTDTLMKESRAFLNGEDSLFADISTIHPHYQAIKFLKNEGVIQGYPDGSFKPENSVSRVEVIKFILEGIGAEIKTAKTLKFKDADKSQWYGDYLYTASDLGIASGYPDGTFKPTNTVNKVEFLKMLVEAMNVDIDPNIKNLRFRDVKSTEWYAPYVQFAIEKNLIDVDGMYFYPTEKMNREAVAEAIFRLKVIQETGANAFTVGLADEIEVRSA